MTSEAQTNTPTSTYTPYWQPPASTVTGTAFYNPATATAVVAASLDCPEDPVYESDVPASYRDYCAPCVIRAVSQYAISTAHVPTVVLATLAPVDVPDIVGSVTAAPASTGTAAAAGVATSHFLATAAAYSTAAALGTPTRTNTPIPTNMPTVTNTPTITSTPSAYTWCYRFDFTVSDGDWVTYADFSLTGGTWSSSGWAASDSNVAFSTQARMLSIKYPLPAGNRFIYSVDLEYDFSRGHYQIGNSSNDGNPTLFSFRHNISTVVNSLTRLQAEPVNFYGSNKTYSLLYPSTTTVSNWLYLAMYTSYDNYTTLTTGGAATLRSAEFRGTGTSPFPASNCGIFATPTPVPTSSPTITAVPTFNPAAGFGSAALPPLPCDDPQAWIDDNPISEPLVWFDPSLTIVDTTCYTVVPEIDLSMICDACIVQRVDICITWYQLPALFFLTVAVPLDLLMVPVIAYMIRRLLQF